MAVIKNGMKRGKEGDVIHSSWHGRPYTRRMPETVANPQTDAFGLESEACGLAVRRHGLKRAIQYFERYGLFSRAGCVMLNTMAEEIARLLCHDG